MSPTSPAAGGAVRPVREFVGWLHRLLLLVVWLAVLPVSMLGQDSQSVVAPDEAGLRASVLQAIDVQVEEALAEAKMPGCVVAIGRREQIVFLKAYGNRQVEPEQQPMTVDTLFDLASLTKPIATATSIMLLLERGKLRLRDPVAGYLPEFATEEKGSVTVEQLMTHQGGLIADNPLSDYDDGAEKAMQRILALPLQYEPGARFRYSDVGYIVLGALVERVSGQPLDAFSHKEVFEPLGMTETEFLPGEPLRRRAAVTQQRDGHWMQGEVHDPRAHVLGGVAGHAGLFSTARDLCKYAQMMLSQGRLDKRVVMGPATWQAMIEPRTTSGGLRSLGWDINSGYSSNRGETFSSRAFGHGGFTGTSLWVDPELNLFVIFLSNRVHPDGNGSVNALAGRIGTIAAGAVMLAEAPAGAAPDQQGDAGGPSVRSSSTLVRTGIDVLHARGYAMLSGKRVGLITNQTGIDRRGVATHRLFLEHPDIDLVALFSPEHGFRGELDQARIDNQVEVFSGVPIYSLYGQTRRPTPEMLAQIDLLVFDIQDIGTRFYTYLSTLTLALEAAAGQGVPVVVLDRPNPINGMDVDGPVLDEGLESFVGAHTLPVRHGMTVGELARMINEERRLGADLTVIPMEGWSRRQYFDETGLIWVNPSPNMRNINEAALYPGIGLLETTNLSVGRGTDTPFELLGAPWIDGPKLCARLRSAHPQGVQCMPRRFVPSSSVYQGQPCQGVSIAITNRDRLDPLGLGLLIAQSLRDLYPEQWEMSRLEVLLKDASTLEALQRGEPAEQVRKGWDQELEAFRERRDRYLLYQN